MGTFSKAFDPAVPTGSTQANTADDTIRDDKTALIERLSLEHYFPNPSPVGSDSAADAAGRHIPGNVAAVHIGTAAPSTAVTGGLWYKTSDKTLRIYDASLSGDKWATLISSPLSAAGTVLEALYYTSTTSGTSIYSHGGTTPYTNSVVVGTGLSRNAGDGTITTTVSGIYNITMRAYFNFVSDSKTAYSHFFTGFYFYGQFYTLVYFGQNVQGGSNTLGAYKGGAGTGNITVRMVAGASFLPAVTLLRNGAPSTGTVPANATILDNSIRVSLVRPL